MKHTGKRHLVGMLFGSAIFLFMTGVEAQTSNMPSIVLKSAIHFTAPDGSEKIVPDGTYGVTGNVEFNSVSLYPLNGSDPLILSGEVDVHEEQFSSPEVYGISVDDQEFHLVLLLPDGFSLESVGSASGIRSRTGKPHLTTKLYGSKMIRSINNLSTIQLKQSAPRGPKKPARSTRRTTIRMRVTGTGKLADIPPFKSVAIRTPPFMVTGTGNLGIGESFAPVRLNIDGMRVTGTGRLR